MGPAPDPHRRRPERGGELSRAAGRRAADSQPVPAVKQGPAGLNAGEPVSVKGDSGAPVLNQNGWLVGVVFDSDADDTHALPILPIHDARGAELIPQPPAGAN